MVDEIWIITIVVALMSISFVAGLYIGDTLGHANGRLEYVMEQSEIAQRKIQEEIKGKGN